MDNTEKLGTERIGRLLFEYSLPAIVGMLVSGCYNIIDRIFIGHSVGDLGIAAVTVAFPIMTIQMALAGLVGVGATANISIKLGQGNKEIAQKISGNAVTLLMIIAVLFTSFSLIFLEPLLATFGASSAVMPYAKAYMSIILLGTVFQCFSFGLNNMMRAEGKPVIAMVTMLIGTAMNTILAPIFIFIFHWGMRGAGLATITSQAISSTWIVIHFLSKKSLLHIQVKNLKLKWEYVKPIILLGLPMFFVQSASCVQNAVMNNTLYKYGGDVAISGMGIVTSIAMLIMMPIFGFNQGSQPIIGFNYGAGKYDRVKKTFLCAAAMATTVSMLGFTMTRLIPTQLIMMFDSADHDLIVFGAHAITVYMAGFMVVGFQVSGSNYFQAVGKPTNSMLLSLSRQVLILIPLLIILPNFLQMNGILIAGPIADLSSFMLTLVCVITEMRKLGNKQQLQLTPDQPKKVAQE